MGHWNGRKRGRWFLFGIPLALLALAVGSFVVMALWNALLPEVFGLKTIGYIQAAGLLILGRILFGRFVGRPMRFACGHHGRVGCHKWDLSDMESPTMGGPKESLSGTV